MGKYIIDIEEGKEGVILCQTGIVAVGLHLNDEDSLKPLGIKSAIPYIEPSRGEIYKNAYQKGYETAKHECKGCNANVVKIAGEKEEAYQKGLSDAWDAARKIVLSREDGGLFDYDARKAVLGCGNYMALKKYSASEAIEKIRQYEQEQEEIKVGDEVVFHHDDERPDTVIVVTYIGQDEFIDGMDGRGMQYANKNPKKWTKTGRHFPEIAEVLRKMREEKE